MGGAAEGGRVAKARPRGQGLRGVRHRGLGRGDTPWKNFCTVATLLALVAEVFVLSLAHVHNLFAGAAGPDYAMAHTADARVRTGERLVRVIRTG